MYIPMSSYGFKSGQKTGSKLQVKACLFEPGCSQILFDLARRNLSLDAAAAAFRSQ